MYMNPKRKTKESHEERLFMGEAHSIQLTLASPETIRGWSRGEVTKPETINYRTGRCERDGLFDERIFGPEKDYECYCGKYRGIRYKGIVCEKCGVEITRSIVRRDRMGHIELATPVSHIWMLRGVPSRMSILLDVPINQLEKVIYFAGYIVTTLHIDERDRVLKDLESEYKAKYKTLQSDDDKQKLKELFTKTKKEIVDITLYRVLTEAEYARLSRKYSTVFEAGIGAEAIFSIFQHLDLEALRQTVHKLLEKTDNASREKIDRRYQLISDLVRSGTRPEWMFMAVLPVIPPELRPMVALEGGRHATSDLNDLYRRVINRNNRLKKLIEIGAPDVILRNEKRILQEAVDALVDNSIAKGSGGAAMSQSQKRSLKSLSDNLKGKQGLLRQNLLGKRVDYSGRSVIVVGPNLKLDECGLPKFMALELFRPFVIAQMIKRELAFNVRGANRLIEDGIPEVWEILEEVIKGKYVLLNRAPTLHRLSIQAFHPVLIEGKAIQVHPLVCGAFNADFDGDQMAVHVPLSVEAQHEAKELIASNKNLLKPQSGDPVTSPSQDIVLGCFWMTKMVEGARGEGGVYESPNAAILAYDFGALDFRAKITVLGSESPRYAKFENKPFETTVGRLLFNSIFPDTLSFVNETLKKKDLAKLIQKCVDQFGVDAVPAILDAMKKFGYRYVTRSGTTWSYTEALVPEQKQSLITEGHKAVTAVVEQFNEGLITDDERYRKTIEIWEGVKIKIAGHLEKKLTETISAQDMINSGARGDMGSYNQVAGMKGIIVNAVGKQLEFPIISSYKEGLSPLEYFINTTSARKGLIDTALNTAKAGYLTRRLVVVAQDVVVRQDDCGTKNALELRRVSYDGIDRPLSRNAFGRVVAESVKDASGKVVIEKGTLISKDQANMLDAQNVAAIKVYSPITCESLHGVCQKCYGLDLGRNHLVKIGEAVGIVAAQAIGEPGTQLTLRTFHAGGVAGRDITQGLPRVEEIFEKRAPKVPAVITHVDGMVADIRNGADGSKEIEIFADTATKADGSKAYTYAVDPRRHIIVKKGAHVAAGDSLTDGSVNVDELFSVAGTERAQQYIIDEVSTVYELHSAPIASKHLELMARQMFSRREITKAGDTHFSRGDVVENIELIEGNEEVQKNGGMIAEGTVVPMGISEVSLSAKSWLSSASFQHTTRTLVSNAVRGGSDELRGLMENVIMGNLIPAGTGLTSEFIPGLAEIEAEKQARIDAMNEYQGYGE